MSPIGGGPGGIRGPGGPGGPDGPDGPDDVDEVDGPEGAEGAEGAGATDALDDVGRAAQVGAAKLDALAAEIAAGKLTAREAIDRMVDEAGAGLPQTERAELRELLTDLVENDPHLAALAKGI